MQTQRHLFQLPSDVHYFNGAYMSPLLRSVEEAGIQGMIRKRNPAEITAADYFEEAGVVKQLFGRLINGHAIQVAIIPSVSYGLESVVRNLPTNKGHKAIVVADDFPSDYYTIRRWCVTHGKQIQVIQPPQTREGRGKQWNQRILESIDDDTAVVIMSSIHWTDGTVFHLEEIGKRCRAVNAKFIVDGTQSVGARPIDVEACHLDALVCAGYKWLLGPYAIGAAWYHEDFNHGQPIEEAWVNRDNAQDFTSLTQYADGYTPGAGRYNVGEYSNFILLPMFRAALEQLLEWQVEPIEQYCLNMSNALAAHLKQMGFWVEDEGARSAHMFGALLPPGRDITSFFDRLRAHNIFVSRRGEAVRISTHVYIEERDVEAFKQGVMG